MSRSVSAARLLERGRLDLTAPRGRLLEREDGLGIEHGRRFSHLRQFEQSGVLFFNVEQVRLRLAAGCAPRVR